VLDYRAPKGTIVDLKVDLMGCWDRDLKGC